MSSHRSPVRGPRRLWRTLALLITMIAVGIIVTRLLIPSPITDPEPAPLPIVVTTTDTIPGAVPRTPLPLVDLQAGDPVWLSRPDTTKIRSCTWLRWEWGNEPDFSTIRCPHYMNNERFTVKTEYLTRIP